MMRRAARWLSAGLPPSAAADPFTERCVFWYVTLIPLWWMAGLLMPLALIGSAFLYVRRLPRDPAILLVSLLWIAVGAAQALSTVVNWAMTEDASVGLLRGLLSLLTMGWILLGLAIGIGGEAGLASTRVVRAICINAAWLLLFCGISLVMAHGFGLQELIVPSPLALLLPGDLPSVRQHLTMVFFQRDALLDGQTLRLTLFYPWATALSLAGAATLLVGTADPVRFWRWCAILGGSAAVVFGYSRSVAVCLVGAFCILGFLRLRVVGQATIAIVTGLALNVALLAGFDPAESMRAFLEAFTNVRAGSSAARNLVYDLSWVHFLERPILGHGWVSEPAARWLSTMPLGSHSSFYGVLYLGGIVTFTMMCIAYLATIGAVVLRLRDRQRQGMAALVLLGLFGVVALGETFSILVPSLLVFFLWLGGVLRQLGPAVTGVGMRGARHRSETASAYLVTTHPLEPVPPLWRSGQSCTRHAGL
jgi:hypothetical protein